MSSRVVEISIARGEEERVCAHLVVVSSLFSSFYVCNYALFVSRNKKRYAEQARKRTKPINGNPPPASPLHGKNQTPRVHMKSLTYLAPRVIYPRHVRKQSIERYRWKDPNPSAGSTKQKKGQLG